MSNLKEKEYLRPNEIKAVFGIDKTTLYRWAKNDDKFPRMKKVSSRITLINKKEFEEYLDLRSKA